MARKSPLEEYRKRKRLRSEVLASMRKQNYSYAEIDAMRVALDRHNARDRRRLGIW